MGLRRRERMVRIVGVKRETEHSYCVTEDLSHAAITFAGAVKAVFHDHNLAFYGVSKWRFHVEPKSPWSFSDAGVGTVVKWVAELLWFA